jgi:hypothetical protein
LRLDQSNISAETPNLATLVSLWVSHHSTSTGLGIDGQATARSKAETIVLADIAKDQIVKSRSRDVHSSRQRRCNARAWLSAEQVLFDLFGLFENNNDGFDLHRTI